ncbi:MAG: phosphatidate cytidylyltransferase [Bacteroidales bacterium]|nr:phosphatidate cytidylyltransferase [Bacteroidales bacterium]
MNKFVTRTLSGAVYVLIVVGAIYAGRWLDNALAGNILFASVFLIIGIIGIYEYINNISKRGIRCNRPMAYIAGVIVYLATVFPLLQNSLWPVEQLKTMGVLLNVGIIIGCLAPILYLTTFIAQLWSNDEEPFTSIGHTLLPSIWIMTPLALANTLQSIDSGIIMMVFILIWVNDSFAYMTGMLLGRNKMWERHSPNKTWEGTTGGALFCIAAAIFAGPYFYPHLNSIGWAVTGLICSAAGTLGDLVESMFKRYCGVKDSGKIMPGHGGVLDRFDSILMAVPFVFFFITIITL